MLGMLQIAFIQPYYRNSKMQTIENVASLIQSYILDDDYINQNNLQSAIQLSVNNNVCALVYNEVGNIIYSVDSLGEGCLLAHEIELDDENFVPFQDGKYFVDLLNEESEQSITLMNDYSNQEMIIYGKKIENNLGNYYLLVNSALEPVESIVNFVLEQYIYLTIIVLIFALALSIYIASRLSKPIVDMKDSAKRLAEGKYDTTFYGESFSEVNELADSLNDATFKLSKVDQLRKDLIANVSHDIKTPLTMIKAYAEMIKDISGDNPNKRNEHLDVIIAEVDYLDHLIVDMQTLSKMQADVVILNRINFDLTYKIEEIVRSFSILLVENELELEMCLDSNVIVYADDIKLSQVIYNFISNAIKHTPYNSKIKILLTETEEDILFEVIDNGTGINEQDLPYIWDRYYKIDKQFARKEKGTGLGLAISKGILEAHYATYGAQNLKKGAKFWFKLTKEVHNENL